MLGKLFELFKWDEKEKPYHVHGLEGYSKFSYRYVGNYRTEKGAWWAASSFVAKFPYGTATVTLSPDEPEYTND